MDKQLIFGPVGCGTAHLCVDMQSMFAEATEWASPWLRRVLPCIIDLVDVDPSRTIFTRFIPPRSPDECKGVWKRYWERWSSLTADRLDPAAVDLLPELRRFVPPASVIDKRVYSPWLDGTLEECLKRLEADTMVVSGGETEVCVLSTVLGAIDRGYRVIVASDALCSSSDKTHDELLDVYRSRYGQHVEVASTAAILASWRGEDGRAGA